MIRPQRGNASGLRLISDASDALIARIALADRAVYSLDLQYYMFHSDASGSLLAQRLLAAADRGVRGIHTFVIEAT